MRRQGLVIVISMIVGLTSVVYSAWAAPQWPMFHGAYTRSGASSYTGSGMVGLVWSFKAGVSRGSESVAIGADGDVYFGTGNGDWNFYAIRSNGKKRWSYRSDAVIGCTAGSPAVGPDGRIYVGLRGQPGSFYHLLVHSAICNPHSAIEKGYYENRTSNLF